MTTPTIPSWIKTHGLALLSVGAAFLLRLVLAPVLGAYAPFLVFVLAVVVTAWYGGFLPGLVATGVSMLVANFFFTEPHYSLSLADPAETAQTLVFVVEGILLSGLSGARLRAQRRAEQTSTALRALTTELTLTEERQRRQIAQGIHDQLQQLLAASRMKAGLIRRVTEPACVTELAQELEGHLAEAIAYTRTVAVELSPPVLYRQGLAAALRWLGEDMTAKHRLQVEVQAQSGAEPAREEARILAFQAVRELLFNVVKHARAERAAVSLRRQGAMICVQVADQGTGFDPAAAARPLGPGGFGLFSIQQRLEGLGGRMVVQSTPGRGTAVELQVPAAA